MIALADGSSGIKGTTGMLLTFNEIKTNIYYYWKRPKIGIYEEKYVT